VPSNPVPFGLNAIIGDESRRLRTVARVAINRILP
jgi:hypothetical protein